MLGTHPAQGVISVGHGDESTRTGPGASHAVPACGTGTGIGIGIGDDSHQVVGNRVGGTPEGATPSSDNANPATSANTGAATEPP